MRKNWDENKGKDLILEMVEIDIEVDIFKGMKTFGDENHIEEINLSFLFQNGFWLFNRANDAQTE